MKLRKQLSVLVAVAMIIGCMPGFVLATETEETQTPTEQTTEVLDDEDQTIDSVVDEDEPEEVTEEEQEEETVETTEFDVESDVYTVEPANQSASEIITTWADLKTALENPDSVGKEFALGSSIQPDSASYIRPVNGVTLDLNGNTIDFANVASGSDSYMFNVPDGVTFTISNGSLTHGNSTSYSGAIMNSGDLRLVDVTVTANTGKYGAIFNVGSLSLNNVTVTGNSATISTMDPDYTQYLGAGVHSNGNLSVQGKVVISGNFCQNLTFSNVGHNLYLANGRVITIAGELVADTKICVSGENLPNVITSGWNGGDYDFASRLFYSDNLFNVQIRDGEVYFVAYYMNRSWGNDGIEENREVIYNSPVNFITFLTSELTPGTYYVSHTGSFSNRLIVSSGTVNIIVKDGVTLTLPAGIEVREGATLNIYSQDNDSGRIVATVDESSGNAGIGGTAYNNAGVINIFGGEVQASGGFAAGIGGAYQGEVSEINIYGGTITSTGGQYGAGIGGGCQKTVSEINIYGGTITSTGGYNGAGIGGSYCGHVSNISIYGGSITSTGGESGAGIGGGFNAGVSTISINGGEITAVGSFAAGIGGGYNSSVDEVNIYDGTVRATGSEGGAGIGGGPGGGVGTVKIYDGTVTAQGKVGGADIGAGYNFDSGINMTIGLYGGTVTLPDPSNEGAAHIGYSLGSKNFTLSISLGDVRIFDVSSDSYIRGTTRVTTLNTQGRTGDLIISLCDHSDHPEYLEYREYSGIDDAHNRVCMYCEHVYTESHHYEDGVCVCGREEGDAPQFVGHSVQLSGQIGLQYFFTLPDGAENCYVTFEGNNISPDFQVTPEPSTKPGTGNTYYMAQLNLSTIQIADSFVPVIHYTVDDVETAFEGAAYSVMDYINWGVADNNTSTSDSDKNILKTLADYGYYSQIYTSSVNGWEYDEAYTTVNLGRDPLPQDSANIRSITDRYAIDSNVDSNVFTSVSFSLRFGDRLSLRVIFKPADGVNINRRLFTVNGEQVTASRLSDGRYAVTITGISAIQMSSSQYTVNYDGTANSVVVSPLSYVNAMLYQDSNEAGQHIVCALFNYATACGMVIP